MYMGIPIEKAILPNAYAVRLIYSNDVAVNAGDAVALFSITNTTERAVKNKRRAIKINLFLFDK